MPQQRDTPPERKHMALIRRASTTLRRSLATYAKVADRETAVAALRLRGWKDQSPKRDAVAKRFEFASFNEAFGWMSRSDRPSTACVVSVTSTMEYKLVHSGW